MTQLLAGNAATISVRPEDVLATKRDQPKLNMYADSFPDGRPGFIGFSMLEGSPFHDVRVRRAVSMLLDRDSYIDTFFNVGTYQSAGLPVESRWHTHYAAGEAPYWIDPKGKGLGEGIRNFKKGLKGDDADSAQLPGRSQDPR